MKMPQYAESFDDESKDRDYKDSESSHLLNYKFEDDASDNKYFSTDHTEENPLYEYTTKTTKLLEITENIDFDIFSTEQKLTAEKRYYTPRQNIFYSDSEYNKEYDREKVIYNRRKKTSYKSHEVNDENIDYDNTDNEFERETKFIKRKPRDRQMTVTNDNAYHEYVSTRRTNKKKDEINSSQRRRNRKNSKRIGNEKHQPPIRRKYPKEYENYVDYEDMKRVINIKDKLPTLLKKSKVRDSRSTHSTTTKTELENQSTDTTYEVSTESILNSTTGRTEADEYVDSTTLTPNKLMQLVTKEMSLAEKSRLSISRKIQKKDRLKGSSTKKPPVLLQLQTSLQTSKLNTIVMLEPSESTSIDPERVLRAREVSNDSEETLKMVKKLMREKLVKNSRSMNDLIDNWDEMICDYIDVSLLKNNGHTLQANTVIMSLCLVTELILLMKHCYAF